MYIYIKHTQTEEGNTKGNKRIKVKGI